MRFSTSFVSLEPGAVRAAGVVLAVVLTCAAAPAATRALPAGDRAATTAITVPWGGDPSSWHRTWSGAPLTLQGVAVVEAGCALTGAEWDPGDGTGFVSVPHGNPRVLELSHVYTAPSDTPFVATLRVSDDCGTVATDHFKVRVVGKTLEVEADRAIDHGLWYLHKRLILTTSGGVDTGYWSDSSGYTTSSTGAAVLAFEAKGHLPTGDPAEDPYVEDVQRGLAHLTTTLGSIAIGVQPAGDPDANGNGIGLSVTSLRPAYEGAFVVDALVASGTPNAVATTGGTGVIGRTYREIVQDLLDAYSWGQTDGSFGQGGWRYSWNDSSSDNDVSRWWALAAIPAERSFSCIVPQFVKSLNLSSWLPFSQYYDGSNAGSDGRFGYTTSTTVTYAGLATTSSGILQLIVDGVQSSDVRFQAAEHFLVRNWGALATNNPLYAMFSLGAAMRLAVPSPIQLMSDGLGTTLDWYGSDTHAGDPVDGVARFLVDHQQTDGSWDGYWILDDHATARAVTLLVTGWPILLPVAVIDSDPDPALPGHAVTLDGTGSFHQDPQHVIVLWEWDLDDDGIYDATGPFAQVAFPVAGDHPVQLRVSDDSVPPLIDVAVALIHVLDQPGIGYCFGDPGSGTPCPCSNDNDGSVPGSGCDNGVFASGARLTGSGSASVTSDTLVLSAAHLEPSNSGLYFQAENDLSPGLAWGDGLRCAGGGLIRLGVRFADTAGSSDTSGFAQPISVKAGNVHPGDTKYYQCWYRTNVAPPCGAWVNDFNTTNGYAITWLP